MSETPSEGMTFDQAAAAVGAAAAADPEFNPNAAPEPLPTTESAPEAEAATDNQAAEPTPGEQAPAEEATPFTSADVEEDSLWAGEQVNPDLLPDELKPLAKQLEGAFTRKTQALAEQRKAIEAIQNLGDPEELRQAHEFYQSLRDPEYLRDFYQELTTVMQEQGLTEAEAAEAVQQVAPEEPQQPELPPELAQLAQTEPELKPFVDRFAQMESRLAAFEQQAAQERQALEEERQLMADAAQIDQQVQAVREAHPDYGDDDWQAIYDFAVAYDGDVVQAAETYEANRSRIIADWTAQKQAVPASVAPTAGAGTVAEGAEEESMTLDQADAAAQAYLDANDLSEFTG